jgi:hypothetical protein
VRCPRRDGRHRSREDTGACRTTLTFGGAAPSATLTGGAAGSGGEVPERRMGGGPLFTGRWQAALRKGPALEQGARFLLVARRGARARCRARNGTASPGCSTTRAVTRCPSKRRRPGTAHLWWCAGRGRTGRRRDGRSTARPVARRPATASAGAQRRAASAALTRSR